MKFSGSGETVSTEDRNYCISVIPLLQNELDKLWSRPREDMSKAQIKNLKAKISKAKKSIQAIGKLCQDHVSTSIHPSSEHKPKADSPDLNHTQEGSVPKQPEAISQNEAELGASEDLRFFVAVNEIINKEPDLITQEDRDSLVSLTPLIENEYARWQTKPRAGLTRGQIGNIRSKAARNRGYLQKIAEILGTDSFKINSLEAQDEASESGEESLHPESKIKGMMLTDVSISRAREQFQASFLKDQKVREGSASR